MNKIKKLGILIASSLLAVSLCSCDIFNGLIDSSDSSQNIVNSSSEKDTSSDASAVFKFAIVTDDKLTFSQGQGVYMLELDQGETYQINATVNADATNKTLSYSTNKNSVASVSNTGLITAKAEGNAVITVTTADGNTATVNVTVNKPASTVYTFTDDYGVDFTVTVVEGVSITLDNGYQDAVFAFDSVATCYRYVDDEYCIVSIRKSGGAVYLDFSDDNCTVFYYTLVGSSDTTGSFELTLA